MRGAPRPRRYDGEKSCSAPLGLALILAFAGTPAFADDCSGPTDCAVLPGNVDISTGIAAGAAGGAAGWVYIRRRRTRAAAPYEDLRYEVRQGEARITELEAKVGALKDQLKAGPAISGGANDSGPASANDMAERTSALQDLAGNLAAERALQAQRVAALAQCEARMDPPSGVDDIQRVMAAVAGRLARGLQIQVRPSMDPGVESDAAIPNFRVRPEVTLVVWVDPSESTVAGPLPIIPDSPPARSPDHG